MSEYDVILIGSGMGGMTTAAALSRLGHKVLLLALGLAERRYHRVLLLRHGLRHAAHFAARSTTNVVASVACLFASFVDLIPFPPRCLFYRT